MNYGRQVIKFEDMIEACSSQTVTIIASMSMGIAVSAATCYCLFRKRMSKENVSKDEPAIEMVDNCTQTILEYNLLMPVADRRIAKIQLRPRPQSYMFYYDWHTSEEEPRAMIDVPSEKMFADALVQTIEFAKLEPVQLPPLKKATILKPNPKENLRIRIISKPKYKRDDSMQRSYRLKPKSKYTNLRENLLNVCKKPENGEVDQSESALSTPDISGTESESLKITKISSQRNHIPPPRYFGVVPKLTVTTESASGLNMHTKPSINYKSKEAEERARRLIKGPITPAMLKRSRIPRLTSTESCGSSLSVEFNRTKRAKDCDAPHSSNTTINMTLDAPTTSATLITSTMPTMSTMTNMSSMPSTSTTPNQIETPKTPNTLAASAVESSKIAPQSRIRPPKFYPSARYSHLRPLSTTNP